MTEFDRRPDAEIRFVAEGEEDGRLRARLRRGAAPLAGSAVVGLGPELYPERSADFARGGARDRP